MSDAPPPYESPMVGIVTEKHASPPTLGILESFTYPFPASLIVEEGGGGNFTVKNADEKKLILSVHSSVMSWSTRKEFKMPNGDLVFTLQKRNERLLKHYDLKWPKGGQFLSMDAKLKDCGKKQSGTEMAAKFRNDLHNGEEVSLKVVGDVYNHKAEIMWNDVQIATLDCKRQLPSLKCTYQVQVARKVDLALVAALCIGFHQGDDELSRQALRSGPRGMLGSIGAMDGTAATGYWGGG